MSRLNAQQAQSFPENTGRGSFLSLSNDGDSAVVRFAYNNVDDIPIYLVHDVPVDGRNRQVGCLRTDNSQPDSVCPLCANGSYPRKVYYFNVRNEETGEMQIWSRSEAFFKKNMETLLREYNNSGTPLTDIPIKIIRKGARGDTQTTYTFIPQPVSPLPLDQFPDEIDPEENNIIRNYNFNDLQNYVSTGNLPTNQANQAQPVNQRIQPRNNFNNFGQPARVEDYIQSQYGQPQQGYGSAPVNTNRRTMSNGGY